MKPISLLLILCAACAADHTSQPTPHTFDLAPSAGMDAPPILSAQRDASMSDAAAEAEQPDAAAELEQPDAAAEQPDAAAELEQPDGGSADAASGCRVPSSCSGGASCLEGEPCAEVLLCDPAFPSMLCVQCPSSPIQCQEALCSGAWIWTCDQGFLKCTNGKLSC